jgi:hypothetical protein
MKIRLLSAMAFPKLSIQAESAHAAPQAGRLEQPNANDDNDHYIQN